MDKLSAMATFVKVVETGSFTRAAMAMGLPKARISQRITDLERVLGVRLLHRTTRALGLTEEGRAYFQRCQQILGEIDELEGALHGAAPIGKLRVEALASIARWILAPELPDFQARFPGIVLRLGSGDRIMNLFEEGIDCAIRGGALGDSSLVARHVCDVQLGLYAAPGYLQASAAVEHPADLRRHQRITWFNARGGGHFAWRLQSDRKDIEVAGGECLVCEDPEVAIAACLAGSGICPGAPFAVESYVESGALQPVLAEWHFAPRPIHILYPSGKHLSSRVKSFVDWSFDVMRASPSLAKTPLALARQFGPSRAPPNVGLAAP
jgi:LysR family transcriptional regulator for bpeEF and oprC